MGLFWNSEPAKKVCSHPWDIIEKMLYPSNVEQLGLDKLPVEEKEKYFRALAGVDYIKKTLGIMKCKDCGEINQIENVFNLYKDYRKDCLHDWEVIEKIVHPSKFQELIGHQLLKDGVFSAANCYQIQDTALGKTYSFNFKDNDFSSKTEIILKCKICGKLDNFESKS